MPVAPGWRIVVVGADASGKDTYANAVVDHLAGLGREVHRRPRWASGRPRPDRTSDTKSRVAHARQHVYFALRGIVARPTMVVTSHLALHDVRRPTPPGTTDLVVSWSPAWAAVHWMARTGRNLPPGVARRLSRAATAFDRVLLVDVPEDVRLARIAARPVVDASDRRTADGAYGRAVVEAHRSVAALLGAVTVAGDGPADLTAALPPTVGAPPGA